MPKKPAELYLLNETSSDAGCIELAMFSSSPLGERRLLGNLANLLDLRFDNSRESGEIH